MKKLLQLLILVFITNAHSQTFESYPTSTSTVINPTNFIEFNNKLFYTARNSSFESFLYATDGTTTGNQQILSLGFVFSTTPDRPAFNEFKIIYNNNLYLSIDNKLYKSDGQQQEHQY